MLNRVFQKKRYTHTEHSLWQNKRDQHLLCIFSFFSLFYSLIFICVPLPITCCRELFSSTFSQLFCISRFLFQVIWPEAQRYSLTGGVCEPLCLWLSSSSETLKDPPFHPFALKSFSWMTLIQNAFQWVDSPYAGRYARCYWQWPSQSHT